MQDGSFKVEVPTLGPKDRVGESGDTASGTVVSPMPGTLEKVSVKEGEKVTKGQQLGTLVAMKMEVIIDFKMEILQLLITQLFSICST